MYYLSISISEEENKNHGQIKSKKVPEPEPYLSSIKEFLQRDTALWAPSMDGFTFFYNSKYDFRNWNRRIVFCAWLEEDELCIVL